MKELAACAFRAVAKLGENVLTFNKGGPKLRKKKFQHDFTYFLQKLWGEGAVLSVIIGATALAFAKNELLHIIIT